MAERLVFALPTKINAKFGLEPFHSRTSANDDRLPNHTGNQNKKEELNETNANGKMH